MPELHLRRFTKHCEKMGKFRETGNFKTYL